MNLRLPVLATVVTAAAGVAAFRALHHEPPADTGFTVSTGSAVDSTANASTASSAVTKAISNAGDGGQRHFSNRSSSGTSAGVTVYVVGEVARTGVYVLPAVARSVDALKAAGGATHAADLVAVNLAEPLRDGEEIVVPKIGAAPPPDAAPAVGGATDAGAKPRAHHRKRRKRHARRPVASSAPAAASDAGASPPDGNAAGTVVDLNAADENELETLPGIGASLAERIVAFREANGPYASPDDLLDVGGMTQSRLDAIEPYVTTH